MAQKIQGINKIVADKAAVNNKTITPGQTIITKEGDFFFDDTAIRHHIAASGNGTYAPGKYAHAEGEGAGVPGESIIKKTYSASTQPGESSKDLTFFLNDANELKVNEYYDVYLKYENELILFNKQSHFSSNKFCFDFYADDFDGLKIDNIDKKQISVDIPSEITIGAFGESSHVEGTKNTTRIGKYSHAEGSNCDISSNYAHAEGANNIIEGDGSHAEGEFTYAIGNYSHVEGYNTLANGKYSHTEGKSTSTYGEYSHAEGDSTKAYANCSHTEGKNTYASGQYAHAEGEGNEVESFYTYGSLNIQYSYNNQSNVAFIPTGDSIPSSYAYKWSPWIFRGSFGPIIGLVNSYIDNQCVTFDLTQPLNGNKYGLYAEPVLGNDNARGEASHSEGSQTTAFGIASHSEGLAGISLGECSHAEGQGCYAIGNYSHVEGSGTFARGIGAHAEGHATCAIVDHSHAEGVGTITSRSYQHVSGMFNTENTKALFIVGDGAGENNRHNAFEVLEDGTLKGGTELKTDAKTIVEAINELYDLLQEIKGE